MDGKQARRTNNSSPIGLMFDHGADGWNAVMLSMTICTIFQIGRCWYLPLFWLTLTAGFYFATLEEYYCGSLDLGAINAVSDGAVLVFIVGVVSAFTGSGCWLYS